jgi:hypothetical protein
MHCFVVQVKIWLAQLQALQLSHTTPRSRSAAAAVAAAAAAEDSDDESMYTASSDAPTGANTTASDIVNPVTVHAMQQWLAKGSERKRRFAPQPLSPVTVRSSSVKSEMMVHQTEPKTELKAELVSASAPPTAWSFWERKMFCAALLAKGAPASDDVGSTAFQVHTLQCYCIVLISTLCTLWRIAWCI